MDGWTDGRTGRQAAGRPTDRQTGRQTDMQTDRERDTYLTLYVLITWGDGGAGGEGGGWEGRHLVAWVGRGPGSRRSMQSYNVTGSRLIYHREPFIALGSRLGL